MKYASKLFLDKFKDDNSYENILDSDLETIIKEETREKSFKIDFNLFYEMIDFASYIPYDNEILNNGWKKAVNDYLKKFYPKERTMTKLL
jgi:hypothetical protein